MLPVELMVLVISKLDAIGGSNTIVDLRMVSKSWNAAVKEYPMTKTFHVTKVGDLRKLCKIIPNPRELTVTRQELKLNLRPLASLTSLTKVSIAGIEYAWSDGLRQLYARLSNLPSSLRMLQLTHVDLPPRCLRDLQCTDLRFLSLQMVPQGDFDAWKMLRQLPVLEVNLCILVSCCLAHFLDIRNFASLQSHLKLRCMLIFFVLPCRY